LKEIQPNDTESDSLYIILEFTLSAYAHFIELHVNNNDIECNEIVQIGQVDVCELSHQYSQLLDFFCKFHIVDFL